MAKRIFFSVGEPSGDLHGSNLIRRLTQLDSSLECVGFGGPKMKAAGCDILYDLTQLAVMFFWEVLKQLRFFFGLVDRADDYFSQNHVDAVVLIDYPGFNWWIARKAKQRGIPVFYYGVPQMWAWAPWRVRKIRKFVDHVLCKLPFEVDWFSQRKCTATYVGHPFFDQLERQQYDEAFLAQLVEPSNEPAAPLVVLLPGSRNQEVKTHLPIMLDTAEIILSGKQDVRIAMACFNQQHLELANQQIADRGLPVSPYFDRTPELLKQATVCVACSGSVSLELLFHRKPTVIVYKIGWGLMVLQAILLRNQFMTLVNLIAAKDIRKRTWGPYNPDRPGKVEPAVMPEYMTTKNPAPKLAAHVLGWLNDRQSFDRNVHQLDELAKRYAVPGATDRAAEYIVDQLQRVADNESQPAVADKRSALPIDEEQAA